MKTRTNSESTISYTPYDQAYEPGFEDMRRRVPALAKLQKLTAFRPAIPLSEIVDRVVAHFQGKADKELPAAAGRTSSATASV